MKKILILGGGTSGWMAAACFAKVLRPLGIDVVLVESTEIGTVGVGEATIPSILSFVQLLGIDEREFIQATQASFKLGIHFVDWRNLGEAYWHQFGTVGANIDGVEFYQHWLKSQRRGNAAAFTDYAPAVVMAQKNKFSRVGDDPRHTLHGAKYALHFDATLVAAYLRRYAEERGVVRIDAKVESVILRDGGNVKSIILNDGCEIDADFFIDCSGFKGVIIEKALQTGYEDWSAYLPCDSAVVAQTTNVGAPAPYTQSTALTSGWQWRIPLQHRTGNGYVFCSKYSDRDTAKELFCRNLQGDLITEPRFLSFITGKRKKLWNKNCVAVGLASGFLEPLESTSIHLAMKAVLKFIEMLPAGNSTQATQDEYNRVMDAEYLSIRDFIILHYCTTQRRDTDFWKYCAAMAIPDTLQTKLELFRAQGRLYRDEFDLFTRNSWYAVLDGMGVRPEAHDPLVDLSHVDEVANMMNRALRLMEQAADGLPDHQQFMMENCRAPDPSN